MRITIPILESMPYAFFSVNLAWKFTYINKKAKKLLKRLNKNRGNLLGENVWKEFPALRKSQAFSEFRRSVSQQVSVEFEEFFQTVDKWLEIQAHPSPEGLMVYLRDISGHKQTTRDLRLLAYALTCTKDCFYLFDLSGKVLFVNKAFLDCFGYREKNILGKDFLHFLSRENSPGIAKKLRAQTARGGWSGEILALRNDGTQFPIELWTSVVKNDEGSPVALVGVARDISERRRAEEAARKSEEQFRLIWESSSDGMCLTTQEGKVVMANDALARMVGKKKREIAGNSLSALYSPGERSRVMRYHRELFRSLPAMPCIEQELTLWNGKKAWYELSISFFEMQGHVPLLLTVFRDITARKRAEDALRLSEAKFRSLAENTSAAVFVVQGTRIVYWNHAAEAVTGYNPARLGSINFLEIIHPDFQETVRAWNGKHPGTENPLSPYEVAIVRKSGETRWLDVSIRSIEFQGHSALMLTCYDVTARKQAEVALQESEERYRRFSELSPVGIAVHAEGKIVFANSAGAKLLGASNPQELIGRSLLDFVHPDYHPIVTDQVRVMMDRQLEVPPIEEKFIRLDGTIVDVEVLATPLTYKNKPAIQVWVHEITERKRTELERRVMHEIIQGVSTTANLDELLHLIHELLKKVVYAENCFVALYNKSTELFELAFFADLVDTPFSPASLAKSCTAYVFRTGRPLLLAQKDFDRLAKQGEVELIGTNSPSWIGIPLKTTMETLGVLVLQHYEKENAYSERDVEFLTSVGSQIALAIERKRTQDTLDASEKRFRSLVQKALDMISIVDQNGIIQYESPSITSILGLAPEDVIGTSSFDYVHPDDLPNVMNGLAQLVATPHKTDQFEARLRHKNGSWRVLESTATNLLYEPSIAGIVINSRDITERRRAEPLQSAVYQIARAADASRTLNDLFREVHRIIKDVMPASNFYISLYNEKDGLLTFPYFVDEVDVTPPHGPVGRGLTAYVLRTGKSLLCDDKQSEELARQGEADLVGAPSAIWLGVPLKVEQKTIGVMTVQHYSDPRAYGEPERQILEFVSSEVARAIDRKRAEQQIRLFAHAFESSAELISIDDLDNRCIFANRSFLDTYGFTAEEILGKELNILDSPKNPPGIRRTIQEETRRGGWTGELFNRKKDGSDFQVALSTSSIKDGEGNVIGYIGVAQDITERKRYDLLQSALYRIAEKARSAEDLQELYSSIHGILSELMYARNCFIALYDRTNNMISFPYSVDEKDPERHTRKSARGITEYVLRSGQPLLATPEKLDELVAQGEVVRIGSRSLDWMGIPLKKGDVPFGVLALQTYEENIRYGEKEKEILTFVSQQIASAIEAKRSQDAIRESEEKFRKLAETATAAIFIYEGGTFRYVNPALEVITGFPRQELLSMEFWDIVHPDFRELVKQRGLARQRGEPAPQRYEFMVRTKSGESRWVDFASAMIEYEGKPAALGTAYDITDHIRAADALRESEERYRTLFEESKDMVFITTPGGRLLDINIAGIELFGYDSKEELLKTDVARDLYYNPDDRGRFLQILNKQGYGKDLEVTLKRKDGSKITVLETSTAVKDEHGNIVAYRGIMKDMTEHKKLEEQLRQKQKLESIGTLAGGVAHDFNNILNIILGYASLIEQGRVDQKKFSQSVDIIKKAVRRGADLVQQILTFARKGDVVLESVNMNEIIYDLAKMLSETFPKTITFSLHLMQEIPSIVGDRTQLQQTLLNLCVNARDSMQNGGILTLSTDTVAGTELLERYADATENQYLHVTVEDTGIGMDEATRSHMFEPFFTTKERGKGTGLGLAVVYGVVKSHHGHVEVESAPNQGTKFHLYFPIPPNNLKEFEKKTGEFEEIRGGSETILLVEDEEMLLDLVKGFLEIKGYTVMTAIDGEEAVEKYKTYKDVIGLVITDMGLPKLGGLEAFLEMKKINPSVKTILASGYLDPDLKTHILKAGAKDFIQKPYEPNEILRKIRRIIESVES